jgi:hypothetical protein
VLEAAGDVRRLVFEVERDIRVGFPGRRQRIAQQMRIRAPARSRIALSVQQRD